MYSQCFCNARNATHERIEKWFIFCTEAAFEAHQLKVLARDSTKGQKRDIGSFVVDKMTALNDSLLAKGAMVTNYKICIGNLEHD